MTPAFVLLNPLARGGTARERYRLFQPTLDRSFAIEAVSLDGDSAWKQRVQAAIDHGVRLFVAAGGDGTVGALATALLVRARAGDVPLESLTLGAIGLGSSNDFHKADRRPATRASALPLRLDAAAARLERPIVVTVRDELGAVHTRISMVSASIGLVARGDLAFNRGGPILSFLKRRWTGGAIALAALDAVAQGAAVTCRVAFDDDEPIAGPLTNLSVGRTRHIAGPLAYEPSAPPSGEHFRADALRSGGRWVACTALGILFRGKSLSVLPQWVHRWARTVTVHADAPFDLEVDGETARATDVTFALAPERLRLCPA